MANDVSAFLETLVGASGDYNAAKVGNLGFLNAVYLDVQPEVARAGKTITVYFPDLAPMLDQQGNDWVPEDIDPGSVEVVFNQRPGKAILIGDFDQWQTAVNIIDKFYDPAYKRGLEYFNGQIAAQITTANFNQYAAIQGLSPAKISLGDATRAWNALAGNKIPVMDASMLSLLTHNDIYAQMLQDSAWTQESIAGLAAAVETRQKAELPPAFNFRRQWDQQAPKTTITLTGTLTPTDTSTAVSGSGTAFSSQCAAFQNIVFANDPTQTPYRIASVTSNTALVLTSAYAANGYAVTAGAAVASTYLSIALHKYAIALAVRPLELVNNGAVQSRIIKLNGIPFRVMLSYQHLQSGWMLTIDCGCAVQVIRPDFGVLVKS